MHVEWNESRCALSGLCTSLAPDVFHLGDDAALHIAPELGDSVRQSVRDAADACPMQAIAVVD
jgi:ferredoxin